MDADGIWAQQNVDITASILAITYHSCFENLPTDVVTLAKQIILDWVGVTVAGGSEPVVDILVQDCLDQNGPGTLSVAGRTEALTLPNAVLVNATSSHALDYDDGNPRMMGHSSVVIVPPLFSIGEYQHSTGKQIIGALLAGHETGMRIGNLVGAPEHYDRGFHATSTLGAFAAAAGAAHLMGLDQARAAIAVSIAGAQASGFKSVFGTMGKPLNAGRCALNGLMGARLAARGFTNPSDLLGIRQGFCDSFGTKFLPAAALATPDKGFHIFDNLFKYHAACQTTHASIEAARSVAHAHRLVPSDIERVVVHVPAFADKVCNIQEPITGLHIKFSVRAVVALALLGYETGDTSIYSEEIARKPEVVAMRDKVIVALHEDQEYSLSKLEVITHDGQTLSVRYHNDENRLSVAEQGSRLMNKFRALTVPVLGADRRLWPLGSWGQLSNP